MINRELILSYENGAALRLKDVADIVDGAENERLAAWADRNQAVLVNVQRQPGASSVKGNHGRFRAIQYAGSRISQNAGFINSVIRPLLQLLALPISVLTLGFFALAINGLMFGLAAYMLEGFSVAGFWPAFFGALLYSIITWAANTLLFSPRGTA